MNIRTTDTDITPILVSIGLLIGLAFATSGLVLATLGL